MNKLQKNIERVLAIKALKEIRHIVENEKLREKWEKRGVFIVLFLVAVAVGTILILKFNS